MMSSLSLTRNRYLVLVTFLPLLVFGLFGCGVKQIRIPFSPSVSPEVLHKREKINASVAFFVDWEFQREKYPDSRDDAKVQAHFRTELKEVQSKFQVAFDSVFTDARLVSRKGQAERPGSEFLFGIVTNFKGTQARLAPDGRGKATGVILLQLFDTTGKSVFSRQFSARVTHNFPRVFDIEKRILQIGEVRDKALDAAFAKLLPVLYSKAKGLMKKK